jgi:hypothetical protein
MAGRILVTALSAVHDTRTVWSKLSGFVSVDPDAPESGADAEITVDMRAFDAGDRLKNWKLRSDLDPDRHPSARFQLGRLTVEARDPMRATAVGTLSWRGRDVEVSANGEGHLGPRDLTAHASFELDVRQLGVEPPKIFFLKVESVVRVEVSLSLKV